MNAFVVGAAFIMQKNVHITKEWFRVFNLVTKIHEAKEVKCLCELWATIGGSGDLEASRSGGSEAGGESAGCVFCLLVGCNEGADLHLLEDNYLPIS